MSNAWSMKWRGGFRVELYELLEQVKQPSPAGRGEGEGLLVNVPTGLGKTAMAVLG